VIRSAIRQGGAVLCVLVAREGLRIAGVGISASARRGPVGRARLSGSMRVGATKKKG
jgi:hypothetical protein